MNAQPGSLFLAGNPTLGVLPLLSKRSGVDTNTGFGGAVPGSIAVIQRGSNEGPQGLSTSDAPIFVSQTTFIDWSCSKNQSATLKNGVNTVDFKNALPGIACRLELIQPPSGAAATLNYLGGDLARVAGGATPTLSSFNNYRNIFSIQYDLNYSKGSPVYIVQSVGYVTPIT